MTDKQSNNNNARRKLLKNIAMGSGVIIAGKGLPENWSRPVVDSVMLPAHAQTSGPNAFTGQATQTAITPDSRFARLLGGLVNEAQADGLPQTSANSICIKSDGAGTVSVDALINDYFETYDVSASSVPVGGAPPSTMTEIYCGGMRAQGGLIDKLGLIRDVQAGDFESPLVEVQVTSIDGNAVGQFLLYGGEVTVPFNLPPGDCSAPDCPQVN